MSAPNNNTRPTGAEGSYTPTRSPQYNNANESQAQRASTSSASNRGPFTPGTNNTSSDEDRRTISRRTYSSGATSSNTNTSAYTMTGGPGAGPAPLWPATPATLTESALGTHQMHAGSFHPVHGWLAQPGPQDRLVRLAVPSRASSSSVRAVGDANSRQSTAGSSISLEYEPAPPPRTMTNDIRGVGDWCRRMERKK